MTIDMGSI